MHLDRKWAGAGAQHVIHIHVRDRNDMMNDRNDINDINNIKDSVNSINSVNGIYVCMGR